MAYALRAGGRWHLGADFHRIVARPMQTRMRATGEPYDHAIGRSYGYCNR